MELFRQAFTIMVLGMTLVFVFLALLIFALKIAARIIHAVEGAPVEDVPQNTGDSLARNRRAAAIAAALHRFRKGE